MFQTADYGVYKCFGQNAKGNDSKLISVSPPEIRKSKLFLFQRMVTLLGYFNSLTTNFLNISCYLTLFNVLNKTPYETDNNNIIEMV